MQPCARSSVRQQIVLRDVKRVQDAEDVHEISGQDLTEMERLLLRWPRPRRSAEPFTSSSASYASNGDPVRG